MEKDRKIEIVFWLIFFAIFFHSFCFGWINSIPTIKSDGWRYINIFLKPWLEGDWNWALLWKDHHPQPITALLFILNAELFGLRMNYETIFSMFFLFLTSLLLYKHYIISIVINDYYYIFKFLFLFIILILFSLKSIQPYIWSLVSLYWIGNFFGLLLIVFFNKSFEGNISSNRIVFLFFYTITFLIAFTDQAELFLFSLIVSIVMLNGNILLKKNIFLLLALLVSLIIEKYFFDFVCVKKTFNISTFIDSILTSPENIKSYITFAIVGVNSSLIPCNEILNKVKNVYSIMSIHILVFLIFLYGIFYSIKNKDRKNIMIPLSFIIFSLFTAVASAIFRFDPSVQSSFSGEIPRYYQFYSLGGIGAVWILIFRLEDYISKKDMLASKFNKFSLLAISIIFCFIAFSQLIYSVDSWKKTPYIKKIVEKTNLIIMKNASGDLSEKIPRSMVGSNYPEPYLSDLKLLKKHKLNIFRDENERK